MRRNPRTRERFFSRTRPHHAQPHSPSARLHLEALEARLVLAVPAGFTETLVTTDPDPGDALQSPTAMAFSPTGELWVLEQSGNVKLISGSSNITAGTVAVTAVGERGLLGITFDSDYDGAGPNTDYMYLYYTEPAGNPPGDPANNRLSRFTVVGAGTTSPSIANEVILRDLPPEAEDGNTNHNGGAIHFGPDGKLYVAVGDHNYDGVTQENHVSQILTTPFGKILRLNADGTNPDDNPFYDEQDPDNWAGAIWALGLRNPFTFSFDPDSGTMFINDVGEGSWEEINEGEEAANYGWAGSPAPVWEGFEDPPPPWANYRDPAMAYGHPPAVAITGGAFYPPNGQFGSDYAGLYFFADYGANFIRTFDPDNPGSVATPDTSANFTSNPLGAAPVDLKVGPDGGLYYLARSGDDVYRIDYTGAYGPTAMVSRQLFYNNSAFDNNDAAAGASDDNAIANNKSAYRPGDGLITPASMSSYSGGINGIVIDLLGNHGPITVDDFTLRVSESGLDANNVPSTWTAAPAPLEVVVRPGAGGSGSDRIELIWADGAIVNRYLEVVVEGNDAAGGFNTNTGLASSDTFYFGSIVGDTFLNTPQSVFLTTSSDEVAIQGQIATQAAVTSPYDMNRDGVHLASDRIVTRGNTIAAVTRIDISDPPAAPLGSPSGGADASGRAAVASALAAPQARVDVGPPAARPAAEIARAAPRSAAAATRALIADETSSEARRMAADAEAFSFAAELDDDLLDALLDGLAGF